VAPGEPEGRLAAVVYWGKYVAHDNNRDAMAATLALTRHVINFVWRRRCRCCTTCTSRSVLVRQHRRRRTVPTRGGPILNGRMAAAWLEQHVGRRSSACPAPSPTARSTPGPRLPDVHRGDAQRHQPALRDVRERRGGHGGAQAPAQRLRPHVVQAEPAAAEGHVVAAEQQQLHADRVADGLSYFADNTSSS